MSDRILPVESTNDSRALLNLINGDRVTQAIYVVASPRH